MNSCFGQTLDVDYRQNIEAFKACYMELSINVTPKVHSLLYHVPDFCDETSSGLGVYSEQASESVHRDFNLIWTDFKIRSLDNPNYDEKLLKAIQIYNSRHI